MGNIGGKMEEKGWRKIGWEEERGMDEEWRGTVEEEEGWIGKGRRGRVDGKNRGGRMDGKGRVRWKKNGWEWYSRGGRMDGK